jgi:hypothetical protein
MIEDQILVISYVSTSDSSRLAAVQPLMQRDHLHYRHIEAGRRYAMTMHCSGWDSSLGRPLCITCKVFPCAFCRKDEPRIQVITGPTIPTLCFTFPTCELIHGLPLEHCIITLKAYLCARALPAFHEEGGIDPQRLSVLLTYHLGIIGNTIMQSLRRRSGWSGELSEWESNIQVGIDLVGNQTLVSIGLTLQTRTRYIQVWCLTNQRDPSALGVPYLSSRTRFRMNPSATNS